MTYLTGEIGSARIQPSIEDQAGAHPRAEGEEDDVIVSYAGTEFPLCHRTGVGVVLQQGLFEKPFFRHLHYRDIIPAYEVGWAENQSFFAAERAAARDANA